MGHKAHDTRKIRDDQVRGGGNAANAPVLVLGADQKVDSGLELIRRFPQARGDIMGTRHRRMQLRAHVYAPRYAHLRTSECTHRTRARTHARTHARSDGRTTNDAPPPGAASGATAMRRPAAAGRPRRSPRSRTRPCRTCHCVCCFCGGRRRRRRRRRVVVVADDNEGDDGGVRVNDVSRMAMRMTAAEAVDSEAGKVPKWPRGCKEGERRGLTLCGNVRSHARTHGHGPPTLRHPSSACKNAQREIDHRHCYPRAQ
jgi:hypothetical protein